MKSFVALSVFSTFLSFFSAVYCAEGLSPADLTSTTTTDRSSYWHSPPSSSSYNAFKHPETSHSTYQEPSKAYTTTFQQPGNAYNPAKQPENVKVNVHSRVTPPLFSQPIVTLSSPNTRNPAQVRVTVNHEESSHQKFNYNYEQKPYQPKAPVPNESEEDIQPGGFVPQETQPQALTQFPQIVKETKPNQLNAPQETYLQQVLKNYPKCQPKLVQDFTWDSSPYFNQDQERFYMPMSYKKSYNQFYKVATGSDLRVGENLNEACYTFDCSWNNLTSVFKSHGKVQESYKCNFLDDKYSMECVPNTPSKDSFLVFGTKTDNKTYIVLTTCWKDADMEWTVVSNKNSLSYTLKQEILSHVQTLGFSRYDYAEASYTSCPEEAPIGVPNAADLLFEHKHTSHHVKPIIPIRQLSVPAPAPQAQYYQPKPYTNLVRNYSGCVPPKNVLDLTWSSTPYFNKGLETFYIPLAYERAYNNFHKSISGQVLRDSQNVNDVCLTIDVNWSDFTAVVSTYGGRNTEKFQCRFPVENKFIIECVPQDKSESFIAFVTKSDDKTYFLASQCWQEGQVDWSTYSNKKFVPYNVKLDILEQVQELGFSKTDYSEPSYGSCGRNSYNAPLAVASKPIFQTYGQQTLPQTTYNYVQNYSRCVQPKNVLDLSWNSSPYLNKGVETFYIPLAHKPAYNNFHKSVSGQTLRDSQNVNDVCLTIDVNWSEFTAVVSTYGGRNTDKFQCRFVDNYKFIFECVPEDKSYSFISFVTKSDDKTYFVANQCWKNGQVDWSTYSNKKYVPYGVKQEILGHVQELGFSTTDYSEPNYGSCARSSYNAPLAVASKPIFQTYGQQTLPQTTYNYVQNYSRCVQPKNVLDLSWNSSPYLNKGVETFYIPLAHKPAYNNFHKSVSGQALRDSQNVNDVCLTIDVNWSEFTAVVTTYGGKNTDKFQCRFLDDYKFIFECIPEDKSYSFISFVTKSDDKTYFVANQCWKNGQVDWTTYSNKKYVPYGVKQEILGHVQELGFSKIDYSEPNYGSCVRSSYNAPLAVASKPTYQVYGQQSRPHSVRPLLAKPVTPLAVQQEYVNFKPSLESCQLPYNKKITWDTPEHRNEQKETLYIPMAHNDAYINYVKLASGQTLRNTNDIKDTCLTTRFNHYNVSQQYYARLYNAQLRTVVTEEALINCGYDRKDSWSWRCDVQPGKYVQTSVTKSDDKSYFVVYNCNENGPTWAVFSKYKTKLSDSLKYEILDHIQTLGFKATDYKELNYDNCNNYESEVLLEDGATAQFPKCNPPNSLQKVTWESTSNFEGVEYFEVAMADKKVPQLYNTILNRRYTYSSYRDSQTSCFRWRKNYKDNTNNLIGYNDIVSYDFRIIPTQEWAPVYVPKTEGLRFRDFTVKTDNAEWMLDFQCWDTGDNTWIVYVKPGVTLSQTTKDGILKTVAELGFNTRTYEEFNYDSCKFNNRLFTNYNKKSCECLN